jgi:hypothetical protein
MENLLDDFEQVEHFTDKEIFTQIWTRPRPVFKFINHCRYEKHATLLFILAGIAKAFSRTEDKSMLDTSSIVVTLIGCIIGGALFGWISYYIYSSLVRWTGTWLKGCANTDAILRILAYASIPTIVGLVLIIPELALRYSTAFGEDNFSFGNNITYTILYYMLIFIKAVLGIWTLVLYTIGIAEVQQFSIGKALINLILPLVVVIIPVLIFVLLFFNK